MATLQALLPCSPADVDEFLSVPTSGVEAFCRNACGDFLVLGAGGKMGLHLAMMLKRGFLAANRSNRVIAVSRFGSVNDREIFERHGIHTVSCDLLDFSQLARLDPCE